MLESKISSANPPPKILILNTPHNPTGKVFTRPELEQLAELAIRYNMLVLSDEVYDHLIYQGGPMTRIGGLPGMWQRTLSIGSAGKTFGVTGWRIGWAIGHSDLIQAVLRVQTRTVFCSPTPFQASVNDACFLSLSVCLSSFTPLLVDSLVGLFRRVSPDALETHWLYLLISLITC